MNIYLVTILCIIVVEYFITLAINQLNIRTASDLVPKEFEGFYDNKKYHDSQAYLKENTLFSLIKTTFFTAVTAVVIITGGFNIIDLFARSFNASSIVTGLIFVGVIFVYLKLLAIPFDMYHTFVLEAKYGFNKTTLTTFVLDIAKTVMLTVLVGGIIFSAIVWFFTAAGSFAWLYCWIAVTLFELFIVFIAPVVIMPLFNKFIPLDDGELKTSIEEYARLQHFGLKGVFKMDASRRSTKSNAFFTGFGKFRRIALFDTLIQRHTTKELVSVLAHEIGHYKKKHIVKSMVLTIASTGCMFMLASFFINNAGLFAAFKMQYLSVYASIVFFGFLFSPLNFIISIISNILSRRHEFEADVFAVTTYKEPEAFIMALKKLTVDNLSNLTPHPLKVFFDYSHPPVLERITAIRKL